MGQGWKDAKHDPDEGLERILGAKNSEVGKNGGFYKFVCGEGTLLKLTWQLNDQDDQGKLSLGDWKNSEGDAQQRFLLKRSQFEVAKDVKGKELPLAEATKDGNNHASERVARLEP